MADCGQLAAVYFEYSAKTEILSSFHMLNTANNWTPEQLRFIQWLACPKSLRKPKNQQLLAKELNRHETTLSDWKRLPGFADAVATLARELLKDDLPDILGALAKEAKAGDVQAIKLALEVTGLHKQGLDITSGGEKIPILITGMDVNEL